MAANNWNNLAADNLYATAGNWSQGTTPTATDTHTTTFDGAVSNANCTISVANRVANILEIKNSYTGTITFTTNLTVSGSITLGTGATYAGAGELRMNATGTTTWNGVVWARPFRLELATTITLADDIICSNICDLRNGSSSTVTINGNSIRIRNGGTLTLSQNNASALAVGTTVVRFDDPSGAASVTFSTQAAGGLQLNTVVNTAGTVVFGTNIRFGNANFTYTAGTMTVAGSTFGIFATTTTTIVDAGGMTFQGFSWTAPSGILQLNANLDVNGTFSQNSTGGTLTGLTGAVTIFMGGSITMSNNPATSTVPVVIDGTGTWSGSGGFRFPVTINTAGTLTISGAVTKGAGTFTYTAGTVTVAGSTITFNANITLDVAGVTFEGLTFQSQTYTFLSDLNLSALLTMGQTTGTCTMNGAFNINAAGSITHSGSTSIILGTMTLRITGTGTYTNPTSSGTLRLNTVINTAGTLTISSVNSFRFAAATLTYTAGTVVTAGTSAVFNSGSILDTNGMSWGTVTFNTGSGTWTFTSDITVIGTVTFNPTASQTFTGSAINVYGSVTMAQDSVISGTTVLNILGAGTWTGSASNSVCRINVNINCGSDTFTFSAAQVVRFHNATMTYISGTVVTTGSTLSSSSSVTYDVDGIVWDNVSLTGSVTNQLLSDMAMSGLLTLAGSTATMTINGPGQFNASGGVTHSGTTSVILGTAKLNMTGGTFIACTSTGDFRLDFDLNGTITIDNANLFRYSTGTLTWVSGAITVTGTTLAVRVSTTTTVFDTDGMTWNHVEFSTASQTITFLSAFDVGGLLSLGSGSGTWTLNGSQINASGGVTLTVATGTIIGTTLLNLTGGTLTGASSTGSLQLSVSLTGDVTISAVQPLRYGGNVTMTYVSGTITTAGSTLIIAANSPHFDVAAVTWDLVTSVAGVDFQLDDDLVAGGLVTLGSALLLTTTVTGPGFLVCHAGFTQSGLTVNGTSEIAIADDGTITIDVGATFSLPVRVIGDATITIPNAYNFDSFQIEDVAVYFASAFDVDEFIAEDAAADITLTAGTTSRVRDNLVLIGERSDPLTIQSDTPATRAFLTLDVGALQEVERVDATDIDSSGGQTIADYRGTLDNTVNWLAVTGIPTTLAVISV